MPRIFQNLPFAAVAVSAVLTSQPVHALTVVDYEPPPPTTEFIWNKKYQSVDCFYEGCQMPWVEDAEGLSVTASAAPIQLEHDHQLLRLGNLLPGDYVFGLRSIDPQPENSPLRVGLGSTTATVALLTGNGEARFTAEQGEEYFLFMLYGEFELNGAHIATITPVPEPAEWALMLAGLGLIGWRARRTRS